MSGDPRAAAVLISCSVLRAEVERLRETHWPDLPLRVEDSMLHMVPGRLASRLDALAEEERERGRRVVLVYGDCCGRMAALEARPGVARTRGNNCCDLLLGRDAYRRLSREGAFFLLPEWTHRWREVLDAALGMSRECTAALMRDMHRKLVYLDTGIEPIPVDALRACAGHCGLPYEVQRTPLRPLCDAIGDALRRSGSAGEAP